MMSPIRSVFVPGGAPQGGAGYNSAAVGNRVYGSGQPMPTVGAIANRQGYRERDLAAQARKQALFDRIGRF